jgi:hypothetical protein
MENVLPRILASIEDNPPCLAPDVDGMTTPKVRKLLNLLVKEIPDTEAYLEVGCYKGATLISALLDNLKVTAYACDDYSLNKHQNPEYDFWMNYAKYRDRLPKIRVIREDAFQFARSGSATKPIGVFFYDGSHEELAQALAISSFSRMLAQHAIIIVDDWNWDWVRTGTWKGFTQVRPQVLWHTDVPIGVVRNGDNFWNSLGIFYIEQRRHYSRQDVCYFEKVIREKR